MATTFTTSTAYVENILSREEYIAACKSNDVSSYRERVIDEVLSSFGPSLFEGLRETLQGNLGTAFQELVNATPENIEVLEREDIVYEGQTSSLEEQREITLQQSFNFAFQNLEQNLKERLRWAQRMQEVTRPRL